MDKTYPRKLLHYQLGWTYNDQYEAGKENWMLFTAMVSGRRHCEIRCSHFYVPTHKLHNDMYKLVCERADAGSKLHEKALSICIRSQMENPK